ncbi:zf-HC2 domain-containing protein [Actinoplanes derwentensis]|uniref:Zinc-finger n=1 Tax=Actinoplanes derwentensis TaxID=113562 RepID=A0A1H2C899_9ACTN|nr:zf-HC2 domain-containing protein [Actinoplanes derwentensis]GID86537.1 hypothetical protein Ade03nite_54610 [Actinoplanes derwentensis]SDT66559.1 hypothetical protein SAMN04489716_5363 [Actinoplanes derwentensis]
MSAPTCDDSTMRTLVGFLVLGRLSEVEHRTVSQHLTTCERCRVERAEIDRLVSVLGMLPVADVRALVADFGVEVPVTGPVPGQLFGAPGAPRGTQGAPRGVQGAPRGVPGSPRVAPIAAPRPVPPPVVVSRPAAAPLPPPLPVASPSPAVGELRPVARIGPVPAADRRGVRLGEGYLPPRPVTGPLSRGPHSHRRSASRRPRARAVVGMTTVLAAVVTAALLIMPGLSAETPGPVVAVASTSDGVSGVEMSAVLYEDDGRVSVRLSATGLAPDVAYQLHAVTDEGEDLLLGQLTGGTGGGTFTGDIASSVDDLWYFSIQEIDGGLMVSANVVLGSPGPDPSAGAS